MATRRRSTAIKSAKAASAPVKKSSSAKSPLEIREVVTKYTQPHLKTVTETKPSATRPEQPNLTYVDYVEDFKIRVKIHNYEVNELWQDSKRFYQSAKPVVGKAIDYVKESYDRAFNETEKEETED